MARAAEPGGAARARASAVIVWSHVGNHRDAVGAGVVVAFAGRRMRIVTARHVVAFGAITVWRNGHRYPGEIARTFAHRDLAIVDALVPAEDALPPEIAALTADGAPGQAITVWGEDESGFKSERGTIVTTHLPPLGDPDAPALIDLTCDGCRPGDSGGGIFDEDGHLVAILTARYRTADGRVVAVVAEPIEPSLYAFG